MTTSNINGKWTGVIVYGKKYREHRGQELYFDAEFTQEGSSISGTAIDLHGTGVNPGLAVISGSISSNIITFVKRYKSLHYFMNGKTMVDVSREGYPIYYSGSYDPLSQSIKGSWEYRITVKFLWIIPVKRIGGGTWTMTRK